MIPEKTCPTCLGNKQAALVSFGRGKRGAMTCPRCRGKGTVPTEGLRRESAMSVARRLGHELPTEAEQQARIDREFPTQTPENVKDE